MPRAFHQREIDTVTGTWALDEYWIGLAYGRVVLLCRESTLPPFVKRDPHSTLINFAPHIRIGRTQEPHYLAE
jgi:hypothetical protein